MQARAGGRSDLRLAMPTFTTTVVLLSTVMLQPVPAAPEAAPKAPASTPAAAPSTAPASPGSASTVTPPAAAEKKEKIKAEPKLAITVDSSEAEDLAPWGEKAKALCELWYPKIIAELDSEGYKPQETMRIVFKRNMAAPAAAGRDEISVSAPYIRGHTHDLGMMVHELTHIVQAYPGQKEDLGWLTEGIADYIRFWKFEPQVRQNQIDVKKASYKDAYRTAAAFLGWMSKAYDPAIVNKLNAKLRAGNADATIFNELTGKSVDELWAEFVKAGAPSSPEATEKTEKMEKTKKTEKR